MRISTAIYLRLIPKNILERQLIVNIFSGF